MDGFGLYYGLHFVGKINSGWEKIDEMIKNGCLSEEGAINLKNILSHSIFLRLKTYLLKGKQSEVAAICEQTNQQFNLNETEKNHLIKYYCTLIPFLEKMQEFCSSNEELSLFLKKQAFFDNSLKTSAVVYGRLHESENAILCLEKYLQEHNNDFEAMLNLGDSYRLCSKRDKAINIYTKTIDLLNVNLNSCSQKHKLILSHCKCNRGTLYRYLERYDEALHDYQYVENFFKEIYPSNSHPDVAAIYNNIGLIYRIKKDFSQAEFYYKQALEISRNIYNSNQSMCIAHCLINFARFLYEKEQPNKIDVKQALEYLKEALNIVELNYGNTHESRVQILADLGITYACDGDFTRGIEYCQRALKVLEEIYKGQKNSELLTIYRNIMLIYRDNIKDYTKALHYSNLCLEIATEIKHPELPKVSSDHEELKTGQLEEPSMFASKSNNTLPKTTIDVPAIVKLEDIQQVVTESRRIAEQRGNIGSRTIDGWELKDVPDEGNCFYEAIADQLQRINHRVIQEVPKGTEIHNWLRLHIQGSNFQDRQWAEDETIYQLIRQFPEIALAIVDTRNSQIGFVYYYHNGEVSLTNTGDNYDPVILAEKTIIKIAATGNHFLSVISHPQLNIGAIIPDTDLPQETQSNEILRQSGSPAINQVYELKETINKQTNTPSITNEQLGWNCFDIAVGINNGIEGRKKIVAYALTNAGNETFRRLLAPEIRHAAALTVSYMLLEEADNETEIKKAIEIDELFQIYQMIDENDQYNKLLLECNIQQILAQKRQLQFPSCCLPEPLRTSKLKNIVIRYQQAHEDMRNPVAICNDALGYSEGQRLSLEQLDNFFKQQINIEQNEQAYEKYKQAREKIYIPCEQSFNEYCIREDIYKQYVQEYYGDNNWFAFQRKFSEENTSTSMIDIVAKMLETAIVIYQEDTVIYRTINAIDAERIIEVNYNGHNHFIARTIAARQQKLIHETIDQLYKEERNIVYSESSLDTFLIEKDGLNIEELFKEEEEAFNKGRHSNYQKVDIPEMKLPVNEADSSFVKQDSKTKTIGGSINKIMQDAATVNGELLTDESYQKSLIKLLTEGEKAFTKDDYAGYQAAEQTYAALAKLAQIKENHVVLIESFYKLGEIYTYYALHPKVEDKLTDKQYLLIKATVLYNCAINVEREKLKTQTTTIDAQTKLAEIERNFLSLSGSASNSNPYPFTSINQAHKEHLKHIRDIIKQRLAEINWQEGEGTEELCQVNTTLMKWFISRLWQECIKTIGEAPCKYAMIAFGSMARGEMTPYSDFEWGILLEDSSRKNKEYFKTLANLLYLKVVNLGETILPAINIKSLKHLNDYITPRGFAFDGQMSRACKTPFGKKRIFVKGKKTEIDFEETQDGKGYLVPGYELLGTPKELAKYQQEEWFEKDPLLPSEISQFILVTGEKQLAEEYQNQINEILDGKLFSSEEILSGVYTLRQYRALLLLKSDLSIVDPISGFSPKIGQQTEEGKIFDVKKDLYRLPNTILDGLGLYYSLQVNKSPCEFKSSWGKVDELVVKKEMDTIFNEETKRHIKKAISIITTLRMHTYLSKGRQLEGMAGHSTFVEPPDEIFFRVTDRKNRNILVLDNPDCLIKSYDIILPLYNEVVSFVLTQSGTSYPKIFREYSKEFYGLYISGLIYQRIAQYHKAKICFEAALKIKPDDLNVLIYLGKACYDLGELSLAKRHFYAAIHNKDITEPIKAKIMGNLGLTLIALKENINGAMCFLYEALKVDMKNHGDQDPIVATDWLNLGLAQSIRGEAARSIIMYVFAYNIYLECYGLSHPYIAICFNNLGLAYMKMGKYKESILFLEAALKIDIDCYGYINSNTATDLSNLGRVRKALFVQKVLEKKTVDDSEVLEFCSCAINCYKKAYNIDEKVFGIHLDMSSYLKDIGIIYYTMTFFDKAIRSYEDAKNIYKEIYGSEQHPIVIGMAMAIRILRQYQYKNDFSPDVNQIEVYIKLGDHYLSQLEVIKAIEHYERAIVLAPEQALVDHNLACCYNICNEQVLAIECFERATNLSPTSAVFCEYGHFLYQLVNKTAPINRELLEKAILQLIQTIKLADNTSIICCELEKPVIEEYLQQLIEEQGEIIVKPSCLAYYLLIKSHFILGHYLDAKQSLDNFEKHLVELFNISDGSSNDLQIERLLLDKSKDEYITEHRHKDAKTQHEYDKRFGLTIWHSTTKKIPRFLEYDEKVLQEPMSPSKKTQPENLVRYDSKNKVL